MNDMCGYCIHRLSCSDIVKLNCEMTDDCDEFERREIKTKKKSSEKE